MVLSWSRDNREAGTHGPSPGPECSELIAAEVVGRVLLLEVAWPLFVYSASQYNMLSTIDCARSRLQLVSSWCAPEAAWVVHLAMFHVGR